MIKCEIVSPILFIIFLIIIQSCCQSVEATNVLERQNYTPNKRKSDESMGILGIVVGPILFILSFVGVWFNEKRAAVNYKRLKMAEKLLFESKQPQQINLDNLNNQFNPRNVLIHKTGHSLIVQAAKDEACQVFVPTAIVIQRKVEVKEMRTYSKRRSGEQEIEYKLEWVSENIQQCQEQYNSPTKWFITTQKFYAPEVRVQNYMLNESQMKMLDCQSQYIPTPETINAISRMAERTGNQNQSIVFNNCIYFPGSNGDIQSRGSLRVKFHYCNQTDLSIICTVDQLKQSYQPFRIDLIDNDGSEDSVVCQDTQCCICCSKLAELLKPLSEINFIMKGIHDAKHMFDMNINKNTTQTNILRLIFFVVMVLGICIFFSPIVDLLGYIPIVGGFLKGTATLVVFIGALLVSIPLFTITFGLAWLRYHPLIGGTLLLFSVSLFLFYAIYQK